MRLCNGVLRRRRVSGVAPLTVLALVTAARAASATTYYVAQEGNDGNPGTSADAPWRSLARVGMALGSLSAGDRVLFRAGQRFYGSLTPTRSGTAAAPIVFGAYGTGARPVITGYTRIPSTWTAVGANRYETALPGTLATVNNLRFAGTWRPLARSPRADAATPYLVFESHAGSTGITDRELSASPSLVDAEIVVRMVHWLQHRTRVTSHSGQTLGFAAIANADVYPLVDRSTYFLQNHPSFLAREGDWYYRTSPRTVGVYASSAAIAVDVSTVERLVSVTAGRYLEFRGLSFEGANGEGFFAESSGSLVIDDCEFVESGTTAVRMLATGDVTLTNSTVRDSGSNGITITSSRLDNVTLRGNTVLRSGMVQGMVQGGANNGEGIAVTVANNATVEENVVRDSGYVGVYFQGSRVTIARNVIDGFCSVFDDGGGIYTWNGPRTPYTDRVLRSNVISRGIGAPVGTLDGNAQANGIYLDNNTSNVTIENNTVYSMTNKGLHMNSPQNVTVTGNTFFDTSIATSYARWVNDGTTPIDMANGAQDISGLAVRNNVLFARTEAQTLFAYLDRGVDVPSASNIVTRVRAMGVFEQNFAHAYDPQPFVVTYRASAAQSWRPAVRTSLAQWQGYSSLEARSVELAAAPSFTVERTVGANLVTNGEFSTNTAGTTVWSANGSATGTVDTTGRLSGTGSLRVVTATPVEGQNTLVYGNFGPVSSTKDYVLRVSTIGPSPTGYIEAGFRLSASPYTNLLPLQRRAAGTARVDHEFVLHNPPSAPGAAFIVAVPQSASATFIDAIAVYEAQVTAVDRNARVRFEVNETRNPRSFTLEGAWLDGTNTPRSGTVTLAPFSSMVLRWAGAGAPPVGSDAGMVDAAVSDVVTLDAPSRDVGTAPLDGSALSPSDVATVSPSDAPLEPDAAPLDDAAATDVLVLGGDTGVGDSPIEARDVVGSLADAGGVDAAASDAAREGGTAGPGPMPGCGCVVAGAASSSGRSRERAGLLRGAAGAGFVLLALRRRARRPRSPRAER